MDKIALQLSMDSILDQANNAFQGLFDGAMDMLNGLTQSVSSLF